MISSDTQTHAPARPDWTYSVPPPKVLSPIWLLEVAAMLSVPLAGVAVIAGAIAFGWIDAG